MDFNSLNIDELVIVGFGDCVVICIVVICIVCFRKFRKSAWSRGMILP